MSQLNRDDNGVAVQAASSFTTGSVTLTGASDFDTITAPEKAVMLRVSCETDPFLISKTGYGGFLATNLEANGIPVIPGDVIYLETRATQSGSIVVYYMWELLL